MIGDDNLKLRVHFSSHRRQTRLVGKLITLLGEHLKLGEELCFELEIATVEAVNNAIIHAYEDNPGQRLDLEITCQPEQITITLSDRGAGIDSFSEPSCPVSENSLIDDLPESGFGLYLIHQVMDKVDYRSQKGVNTLIMTKNLPTFKDAATDRK